MSGDEVPRLLARERDELSAVVTPLREGRRVVAFLVCEARVRPAVLAYLREASGVEVPEPEEIREPGRMLDVLVEVAALGKGTVRSVRIDHTAVDLVQALNWNREKLRRGASVLLWFEGIEGLRTLRAMAPDAYSFRDVMVVVHGEEEVRVVAPEVDAEKQSQLLGLLDRPPNAPTHRAALASAIALSLANWTERPRLRRIIANGLAEIPPESFPGPEDRMTRAQLYSQLSRSGEFTESVMSHQAAMAALAELDSIESMDAAILRVPILTSMSSPLGFSQEFVRRGLSEGRVYAAFAKVLWRALYAAAGSAVRQGNLREAADYLREAETIPALSNHQRALLSCARGDVDLVAGKLSSSEERYRAAAQALETAGSGTVFIAWRLVEIHHRRGEIGAALHSVDVIQGHSAVVPSVRFGLKQLSAEIFLSSGGISEGLTSLRGLMHEVAALLFDQSLYEATSSYITSLAAIHDAGRLTPEDLATAHAELDVAEDVALSIARDDPPWYTILYPGLRAELLALQPDRLDEAITLATTALERARARWTDAVPMHARMHVAHLVRAGRLDEARAALAVAEPEAEAQRHLRELARLRAYAVVVLVRAGAPAADVQAKLAALRATLDETDAPRIVADTLLELSRLLPPSSQAPDPLELLDEAYALFVEMPIPAQEARCLEVMGDVLAARGESADARRRYLAAKGTYERYGLGLRVPAVERKLG